MLNPDIATAILRLSQARDSFYAALDSVRASSPTGKVDGLDAIFNRFQQAHNAELDVLSAFAREDLLARFRIPCDPPKAIEDSREKHRAR